MKPRIAGAAGAAFAALASSGAFWLTAIFAALRIGGVTDWDWWLVISPLWICIGLSLLFVGLVFFLVWRQDRWAPRRLRPERDPLLRSRAI